MIGFVPTPESHDEGVEYVHINLPKELRWTGVVIFYMGYKLAYQEQKELQDAVPSSDQ